MPSFRVAEPVKPCRRCRGRMVSKWHRHWVADSVIRNGDTDLTDAKDIPCQGDVCELNQGEPNA